MKRLATLVNIGMIALLLFAVRALSLAQEATPEAATDDASLIVLDETRDTRVIRHRYGETEVPLNPQRIVTLQDQNMLLPLLEMGAGEQVVGSVGSRRIDGTEFFRRTDAYDTSTITFVGLVGEPNLEAIVALQPDLILGSQFDISEESYAQLAEIAPTVPIIQFERPLWGALYDMALLVDRQEEVAELQARYEARVAEMRAALGDPAALHLSLITPYSGTFYFDSGMHDSSTTLLRDLGVSIPALHAEDIASGSYPTHSIELLREADGDVLYIYDYDDGAGDEAYAVEQILDSPLFSALNAAQQDQIYVVDGTRTAGIATTGLFYFLDLFEETLLTETLTTDWEPAR